MDSLQLVRRSYLDRDLIDRKGTVERGQEVEVDLHELRVPGCLEDSPLQVLCIVSVR